MTKYLPNLRKDLNLHIQEAQPTLSRIKGNKSHLDKLTKDKYF